MADLQSTNRVALAKVRETTFGVTPTNPVFKAILQTSSGLAANPQTVELNIITPDRQVVDQILVGEDASGPVGGELAFSVVDDDFEEALQNPWSNNPSITVATIDTEISDVSATTLTVASGGASFIAGALTWMQGFTTPGNNKLARVSSSSATTIVYPSATFAVEAAQIPVGASVRAVGLQGAATDFAAVTSGGNGITSIAQDLTVYGISTGEWMKVGDGDNAGCAFTGTPANNGLCRVSGVTTHKISFDRVPVGWAADAGTGITLRLFLADFLTNGSTKISNTIERQYLAHSPVTYEYLRGMTLNTLAVDGKQSSIATYTKSYLGKDAFLPTPMLRITGSTDVAAPTFGSLNTSSNVGQIAFDGTVITGPNYVLSAGFTINNNLRKQPAVGFLGAVGTGNGEFSVTGTLETYFGDPSIYRKIVNNTLTSFNILLGRTDGNRESIMFDFPSIKFSGGSPSVSGKNSDVTIPGTFTAIKDAVKLYTMSVSRFWYLPIV